MQLLFIRQWAEEVNKPVLQDFFEKILIFGYVFNLVLRIVPHHSNQTEIIMTLPEKYLKWNGIPYRINNIRVSLMMTWVCVLMFFTSALAKDIQVKSLTSIIKPQVTFVELGSKSCIPCRLMQPVMLSVERRFGTQVKVIFYDVSSSEQSRYADLYSIRLIPTQVFLNNAGKEFFRHEGFYSEAEITKLLKSQGLKPLNNN